MVIVLKFTIMKILVVEDEVQLLHSIVNYFQEGDIECEAAIDFKSAKLKLEKIKFDCCIVDIGLPDGSGLDLIKDFKQIYPELRVIIITARNSVNQRIEGISAGADEYMTKPFYLSELNSKIYSVLGRFNPSVNTILNFNEIKVRIDSSQVFIHEIEIPLTSKEFDLLVFFITNKNKVISKYALIDHLWENFEDPEGSYDFLYSQIKNLRNKISAAGGNDYIQNVTKIGYRFM